jgi:hypothetical protein
MIQKSQRWKIIGYKRKPVCNEWMAEHFRRKICGTNLTGTRRRSQKYFLTNVERSKVLFLQIKEEEQQ